MIQDSSQTLAMQASDTSWIEASGGGSFSDPPVSPFSDFAANEDETDQADDSVNIARTVNVATAAGPSLRTLRTMHPKLTITEEDLKKIKNIGEGGFATVEQSW